ncbi:MAG: hypothetical protein ACLS7B_10970 [Hominilimicola sp.]
MERKHTNSYNYKEYGICSDNRTYSRPKIANKLDNMADYDTVYNL